MKKTKPIKYHPIGVIRSPFKNPEGIPIQSSAARGVRGTVHVLPKYRKGLKNLNGFSHIILIYHMHLSKVKKLIVTPFLDNKEHGVFATRSPAHPNSIGVSVVRLKSIKNGALQIEGLDMVDGTPLIDIKPYVPRFDIRHKVKIGWLKDKIGKLRITKADRRFT